MENYALVIGGTGMLKNVCHFLAENNYMVTVIGRNKQKHRLLKDTCEYPKRIHSVSLDYHNTEKLTMELEKILHTYGCPSIVVSWIHSDSPDALPIIIDKINYRYSSFPWRLFHIQGSSYYLKKENTPVPENCQYRRIFLGFILEKNRSRWLTHEEIANGVIDAIKTDQIETIVGTIEPWDKRP